MGGDEDAQRTVRLYQACYDRAIRSHETLQGVIILTVQERRRYIGFSKSLSDSVYEKLSLKPNTKTRRLDCGLDQPFHKKYSKIVLKY